ncbi:V-set and transmembrane domain-containing protein 4 [Oncorhynchus tshawytscha]|uniref:V-set and transmembrane domain containing 4a n=1 Tax=Oncorhynchus tshawytscha TaxID=74940 RepID=A0AAZ3PPA1_ONCTS|nr:V-set and transmembrane domain-containing protein 4 [Oncorhynchus tshawytscha]
MNFSSVMYVLLTRALIAGVCEALNVTVIPGPVVMVSEGENLNLSCLVSQKKRSNSFLVLRWLFSPPPPSFPPLPPSPSPPLPEQLIVKLTMKKIQIYGNYSCRFSQPKFHLYEEREGRTEGEVYGLLVLNVTRRDRGFYTCRVQEIRRHRNSWKASSNGTSAAQLTVYIPLDRSDEGVWRLFGDVYLCAVLLCSLGLLSIFLFTLVLTCQYLHTRHTLKKASYYLVKCPESCSGETVTSSVSSSSLSPGNHRKEKRHKACRRDTPREPETPPHRVDKVPVATERQSPRKPLRLKSQPRRPVRSSVYEEDGLTYAELELVRPRPETPSCSTSPSSLSIPEPLASSPSSSDTVYAQILFREKPL